MDEQIRQIGERIRGLRDALDLSVEDMAGQCGCRWNNISRLSRASVTLRSVRCSKSDGSATCRLTC